MDRTPPDHPTASEPRDLPRLVGSDRVLAVLRELAGHADGVGLDEISRVVGSPKPTVHRALSTLRRAGFADQDNSGRYVLGDEFLRLAFTHHEQRPEHVRIRPVLQALAARFGETAHYAVLDGSDVVYRAKVDPPGGGVRLTSVVGGRNPAHATAVGKMLLADQLLDADAVARWIGDRRLQRRTEHTLTTTRELHGDLTRTRSRGYAIDDQESEMGINCVALPVYLTSPSTPTGAISVSALAFRMPLSRLIDSLDAFSDELVDLTCTRAA